jgi:hypothetical protein
MRDNGSIPDSVIGGWPLWEADRPDFEGFRITGHLDVRGNDCIY